MVKLNLIRSLSISLLVLVVFTSCNKKEIVPLSTDEKLLTALEEAADGLGVEYYILPASDDYNSIPQDPLNPLTPAKVTLGKLLFHETGLGTDPLQIESANTYSCASCHHASAGFQAGVRQGLGEGGVGFGEIGEARRKASTYFSEVVDAQTIKTPSILNTAFQPNMLWSGSLGANGVNVGTEEHWVLNTAQDENFLGFDGVETQAITGQDIHRMEVVGNPIFTLPEYEALIAEAFPGEPFDRDKAGLAMAAYERTVLANKAPWQEYLKGDLSAMSEEEKQGALLFFSKARCYECHTGPALNSMGFHALGMNDMEGPRIFGFDVHNSAKNGRGGFTEKTADMNKFKVPQLYNLKDSPFMGHGGNFTSVKSIIEYKNKAVVQNPNINMNNLSDKFVPLELTAEEIDFLTLFIEESLRDPDLERYVPAALPTGFCFPNNDTQSQVDLGCN